MSDAPKKARASAYKNRQSAEPIHPQPHHVSWPVNLGDGRIHQEGTNPAVVGLVHKPLIPLAAAPHRGANVKAIPWPAGSKLNDLIILSEKMQNG